MPPHSFHLPKAEPSDTPWSSSPWPQSSADRAQTSFRFCLPDDSDDGEAADERPTSDNRPPPSRTGACVHCKSLKVRCEFIAGHSACRRCENTNVPCLSRSRKKRKPAPTHEDLQEKADSQDRQIQSLLLQLDKMKDDNKIRERLARAHSFATADSEYSREAEAKTRKIYMDTSFEASAAYFSNDQSLSGLALPDIVRYGCLHPEDIRSLFDVFFKRVNSFFSILDPDLHTPEKLIWTSPFLFTVICATALRYCPTKRKLYHVALDFARDAAGKALVEGSKGVDVCQAYLLLAVYPVPKKKWAQDRSWLLMGVAIRMATELELHLPPPPQCNEREALNRTRTWLNCYCVDGSHAIQFGKMPMLCLDDYMARTTQDWYKESNLNIAFDVHLCAYVQIILIMAGWRSLIRDFDLEEKIRNGFDIVAAAIETEEKLSKELNLWVERYAEEYTINPLQICAYRGNTTQLITAYLRLVVLAAGFQHAVKSGISRNSEILRRSIDAARMVIQIMIERLYPTGHLKYAMGAHFLYVAFAASYLVNLLRPKFLPFLDQNTQGDIIFTVVRLIEVLSSKEVVLDGRHTPILYSRFLKSLLAKYNVKTEIKYQYNTHQTTPPSDTYSQWPDIGQTDSPPDREYPSQYDADFVYQQSSNMDFSMNHFVRTVSNQGLSYPTSYNYEYQNQPWDYWGTADGYSSAWSPHHGSWTHG